MSRQLRIGVDATSWTNRRGYGRFARNVLGRLVELDQATRYVFVVDEETALATDFPDRIDLLRVRLSRPPGDAASAASYRPPADVLRLWCGRLSELGSTCFSSHPCTRTSRPSQHRGVVGVHDLIADDFPALTFSSGRARTFWRIKQQLAVKLARRLFTVSHASQQGDRGAPGDPRLPDRDRQRGTRPRLPSAKRDRDRNRSCGRRSAAGGAVRPLRGRDQPAQGHRHADRCVRRPPNHTRRSSQTGDHRRSRRRPVSLCGGGGREARSIVRGSPLTSR